MKKRKAVRRKCLQRRHHARDVGSKEETMAKWIITAESGSDITAMTAKEKGIEIIPMHVSMGDEDRDDGSFPPEEICRYYETHKKLPKTSGCSPDDFMKFFERVHRENPGVKILHLAYSAVTTVSYSSACMTAKEWGDITVIDTKHVSAGQMAVILQTDQLLREKPDISEEELFGQIQQFIARTKMCFIPSDLTYLHAGGRCSNAAYLGGQLLRLHPCIEILDGKLVATKKYRGSLRRVVPQLISEYTKKNNLDIGRLWFIRSVGLPQEIQNLAEETAKSLGYQEILWVDTGCVITTHGGPSAFGIVGVEKKGF